MNPQQNISISLTKKLIVLIILGVASIFAIKHIFALGRAQSPGSPTRIINGKRLADKEPSSERTSFTENGPLGRWSGSIIPDLSRNSTNSPVVVIGNSTLMGNERLRNLQLTHITLKNYSSKIVLAVQLKWFVTTKADPKTLLPPPGYTGYFEANVPSGDSETVECPLVKFSRATKYLVKNGTLDGDFFVQIKVYQVEFEDGTSWNDDWGGPKPGERGERWQGPTLPKPLQNHVSSPLQASCGHSLCSYNTPDSHSICESYPS
jgi:hypothetical protein